MVCGKEASPGEIIATRPEPIIPPKTLFKINSLCNGYIPPWGVVVLHIGVGRSPTPMCKTTPQGGI